MQAKTCRDALSSDMAAAFPSHTIVHIRTFLSTLDCPNQKIIPALHISLSAVTPRKLKRKYDDFPMVLLVLKSATGSPRDPLKSLTVTCEEKACQDLL